MRDVLLSSVFLLLAVVFAIAVFFFFARMWPSSDRRQHNEMIGWQLTVTGTTYAVVVGFMLYAVWNNYQAADSNAEAEANSIINIVRSANGLPVSQGSKLLALSNAYVDSMLTEEWPAMKRGSFAAGSRGIVESLWKTTTSSSVSSLSEQVSLTQTLVHLSAFTEHRRIRYQQARSGIPSILWVVLIVGAVVIIISSCMLGSLDLRVQVSQLAMFAFVLSLILIAIGDLSGPFSGMITVRPTAFEQAKTTLSNSVKD